MAKKTFKEENFLAEVYDDGQFRFIESVIEDGDPAKHVLLFNSRNFNAEARSQGGSTHTTLEDLLKEKKGFTSFASGLYEKGVAFLAKQGIEVPMKPAGYSELKELYHDLIKRPAIDLDDVKPGMLIAYIHPTIGNKIVNMLKVGKIKPFMEDEIMVWVKPTKISKTFVSFAFDPKTNYAAPYERDSVIETMARKYPVGKTKIVKITEEDMKKVKALMPEEVDESLERVHYKIMDTNLGDLIASDRPVEEKVATIAQFLAYSMREYPGQGRYKRACEFLVDNRGKLASDVFICLPGGLSGNKDPVWAKVKENSESRCGCGNERIIHPEGVGKKRKYIPSELGNIVVSPENEVYLKPVNGSKESTYVKLYIEGGGLAFMERPFAPLVMTPNFLSINGYKLKKLAEILPEQKTPLVFVLGETKTPIFAISAVDTATKSVTITPDKGIEVYKLAE